MAGALLLPAPEPPPEPLTGLIIEPPGLSSPEDAGIWYCPWAQSGLATPTRSSGWPRSWRPRPPSPSRSPSRESRKTPRRWRCRGGERPRWPLSRVAQRGDSPGFVEFTAGPAAVSATIMGEGVLAADACVSSGPATWHFPGGSTMPGEHLALAHLQPLPRPGQGDRDRGVRHRGGGPGRPGEPARGRPFLARRRLHLAAAPAAEPGDHGGRRRGRGGAGHGRSAPRPTRPGGRGWGRPPSGSSPSPGWRARPRSWWCTTPAWERSRWRWTCSPPTAPSWRPSRPR